MRIGHRLFLAVLPGIVGLLTVSALAYWGQYAHRAPISLVIVAIVATVASLVMAWYNTRYVARRVERLAETATGTARIARPTPGFRDVASAVTAGVISQSDASDELDEIESRVHSLSGAMAQVRNEAARSEQAARVRADEYATVLDNVAQLMTERLEDAELPLHVLLSSPFGSLNENQEEMLAAAQAAVGVADAEVRRLRKFLDLDRGRVPVMLQPVSLTELLKPALAIAGAHARRAHIDFRAELSDTAPRVIADPVHAQEALTTVFRAALDQTTVGGQVFVEALEAEDGRIRITVNHGSSLRAEAPSLEMCVARRLFALQHGTIVETVDKATVEFPSERLARVQNPASARAS